MRNRGGLDASGDATPLIPVRVWPSWGFSVRVPAEFRVFQPTYNGNSSRMGGFTVIVLLTAIALVLIFVWAAR